MQAYFAMMAAYNAWANRLLYDACAALPEADVKAGLGAFFGSLLGTLNHVLVADRIWMARLTGEEPAETRLDAILYDDLAGLRAAREADDARLAAFVAALDDAALGRQIEYRMVTRPVSVRQPLGAALMHVFNHQTHHRGQCHAMLTRLAVEAPVLDLVAFQRESGMGVAA